MEKTEDSDLLELQELALKQINYLYIVSNDRVPEIDFDQMTLTK